MFIIERWIGGTHFHASTRCKTERAALKELERFEQDPAGYRAGRSKPVDSECCITPELIDEYETYQVDVKKVTPSHGRDCARYLEQWMYAFEGRDLRRLDLHNDIKAALKTWPRAKRNRIVALKGFTAWMRREKGRLKRSEDPTLDLQVPQSRPEKLRRKKVVPLSRVQAIMPHLRADCRDTIELISNTGLHLSEVRRFMTDGELFEPSADKKAEGALAMLAVKHKSGRMHVVALTTDEALAAAKNIRVAAWVPSHSVLWFAMRAACAAAGVEVFNAGVLRHSVATWLHERGVPLQQISEQLGHRDPRTTADFYRDMGGQARALPLPAMKLRLVK